LHAAATGPADGITMMGTPTRKSIFALRYTTGAAKTSALYEANTDNQAQISVRRPIILTKK